jgi:hypothetical protein
VFYLDCSLSYVEVCSALVGSWTRHIPRSNVHIPHLPSHRCLGGTTALWTNAKNSKVMAQTTPFARQIRADVAWYRKKRKATREERYRRQHPAWVEQLENRRHRHLGFLNLFIPCLKGTGWRDTSVPDPNPDPDPHVFGPLASGSIINKGDRRIRIRILLSASKNRNLNSYCFVTSFGLFIFDKLQYITVPSKSNNQKNFLNKLVFVGILKVSDENSKIRIQNPDPLVRGMDPRILIRIHTKMSWIRYTSRYCRLDFHLHV